MRYVIGNDWRDLFDVVVVRSRKPTFFTDSNRLEQKLDGQTDRLIYQSTDRETDRRLDRQTNGDFESKYKWTGKPLCRQGASRSFRLTDKEMSRWQTFKINSALRLQLIPLVFCYCLVDRFGHNTQTVTRQHGERL